MQRSEIELTWLGHATFLVESPEGEELLLDPWLDGNPSCPEDYHSVMPDGILITHGHPDHIGDVSKVVARTDGPVVGIFEIANWLQSKGASEDRLEPMNKGGTIQPGDLSVDVTMVDAHHSSSIPTDGGTVYLGEPAGYVVEFSNGEAIYFAGDTCLFGDMEWIGELYDPDAAVLPIGDRFTMDPKAAAHAVDLLGVDVAVPCHWGTFDALTGRPEEFAEHVQRLGLQAEVVALEPGESWG